MLKAKTYSQIKAEILQGYLNNTGIVPKADSDVAIRADALAAVIEGMYADQDYVLRQLFSATADEPYLYIHAQKWAVPRQGGSLATGQIYAIGETAGITLPKDSKLTDGKGNYWITSTDVILDAYKKVVVPIQATQADSAHNQTGTLRFVSTVSGLQPVAEIQTLSGGSDFEALERWRNRIEKRQQQGKSLSRIEDLRQAVLSVAGVASCYVYPARRGAGSVDVAITAQGANGATVPSQALLNNTRGALEEACVFFEDVRTFKPTVLNLNVSVTLIGAGFNAGEATRIVNDYLDALIPAETYRESVLTALLLKLDGVTDVQLTPNNNVVPSVDMTQVGWIRRGNVSVNV